MAARLNAPFSNLSKLHKDADALIRAVCAAAESLTVLRSGRPWPSPVSNLRVMRMRQHLNEVAHFEQRPEDRVIAEMTGAAFGDAVRDRSRGNSPTLKTRYPTLTPPAIDLVPVIPLADSRAS
jgi:hypothetical protein